MGHGVTAHQVHRRRRPRIVVRLPDQLAERRHVLPPELLELRHRERRDLRMRFDKAASTTAVCCQEHFRFQKAYLPTDSKSLPGTRRDSMLSMAAVSKVLCFNESSFGLAFDEAQTDPDVKLS